MPHTTLFVEPQAQPEHKQHERKSTGSSGLPRDSPGHLWPVPTLPQVLQEPRCSPGSSGPAPAPPLVETRLGPVTVPPRPAADSLSASRGGTPGSRASTIHTTLVRGPSVVCPLASCPVHTARAPQSGPLPTTRCPPAPDSCLCLSCQGLSTAGMDGGDCGGCGINAW